MEIQNYLKSVANSSDRELRLKVCNNSVPKIKNVKVAYIRTDLLVPHQNLKEWCEDENNVYIGRSGIVFVDVGGGKKERYPKHNSKFFNPYRVNKSCSRNQAVRKYNENVLLKFSDNEILGLAYKNIGCWCHPELCHGDAIIERYKSIFNI